MLKFTLQDNQLLLSGSMKLECLQKQTYQQIDLSNHSNLLVNLTQVTDVNSFFVAWLIGLNRMAKKQNCQLQYCNLPQELISLITLYRLEDNLNINQDTAKVA